MNQDEALAELLELVYKGEFGEPKDIIQQLNNDEELIKSLGGKPIPDDVNQVDQEWAEGLS